MNTEAKKNHINTAKAIKWANSEKEKDLIIRSLLRREANLIVGLALQTWHPSCRSGTVYISLDQDESEGRLTNEPSPNQKTYPVYTIPQNFLQGSFEFEDFVNEKEFKQLKKKFGEEANFLDPKQLRRIEINLLDRIKEYLVWDILA